MQVRGIRGMIRDYGLYFSWIVALVAVGGSLYFSEVLNFVPCKLCWFQRIFMYPQVILLGIACYRGDRGIRRYVLPMTVIGGCISAYQYMEQRIPFFAHLTPCTVGVPCDTTYIHWLGFITIPLLAFTGFLLITVFLSLSRGNEDAAE